MKDEQNDILETQQPTLKKYDIYTLLLKYLEMIDAKIYKKASLPRFISLFSDFKEYLSDSFSSFYTFIELNLEQKVNDTFILVTIENILERMLDKYDIPNENEITKLINMLGKEYDPMDSKFVSSIMIENFENNNYRELFQKTNLKLDKIIFEKKLISSNYFEMLSEAYDSIKDQESNVVTEKIILDFYIKYKKQFNLNFEIKSIKSLIKYIKNNKLVSEDSTKIKNINNIKVTPPIKASNKNSEMEKEKLDDISTSNTSKDKTNMNKSKSNLEEPKNEDSNQFLDFANNFGNNLQIDLIKNIFNEKMEKLFKQYEEKISLINLRCEGIEQQINKQNKTIKKLISENEKTKSENISLKDKYEKSIELGLNNNQKIKIIEQKLYHIQIRDLLKGIVNHNLALLQIERKGKYCERIKKLVEKIKNYEGSGTYIKFFHKISELINNGNELAHNIEIKNLNRGKKVKIIDFILGINIEKTFKNREIRRIKDILNKIGIENTLEVISDSYEDKNSIYENIPKCDLRQVLKDTQNIK